MAGLSATSRAAVSKLLQDWREAFDEHGECERELARLRAAMDGLQVRNADAMSREFAARDKLADTVNSHIDDREAVDQINALIAESTKGIRSVHVVSGMGGEVAL